LKVLSPDMTLWIVFDCAYPTDSDITVRRKVAFLLNALLIPSVQPPSTQLLSHAHTEANVSATTRDEQRAVILHPTDSNANAGGDANPTMQPVHPNSHAAMISDPASFSTSELTRDALERAGLLQQLVDALARPTPHGPDGEQERDTDFEEKVIG
jgi:hsp70-interacting protein